MSLECFVTCPSQPLHRRFRANRVAPLAKQPANVADAIVLSRASVADRQRYVGERVAESAVTADELAVPCATDSGAWCMTVKS